MNDIIFGTYIFSAPEVVPASALPAWVPDDSGLYVILAYDVGWTPKPYRPLYFGESQRIRSRATCEHERHVSWGHEAGVFSSLYRALCPLPNFTMSQLQRAESALIAQYNTPCNERLSYSLNRLLAGPPNARF